MSDTTLKIERLVDGVPVADTKPRRSPRAARKAETRSAARLRGDNYLWGIYIFMLVISVIELYSASATEVKADNVYSPLMGHAFFLCLGVLTVILCQQIHYKYYRKMAWWVAGISIGLVLYGNTHGAVINGAMRAIVICGVSIQPPELAKLAMVLIVARVMARCQMPHGVTDRGLVICTLILGIYGALLYTNGLTNMLLIMVVGAAMFITGGTQWRKLLILAILAGTVAGFVVHNKFLKDDEPQGTATELAQASDPDAGIDRTDMRKGRISTWLAGVTPADTLTDLNRQVLFARMSQAHGGVFGHGPGNSRESARLPLAFSDYIYSIIVEDTGMVGGIFLLLLYIALLARAGVIAAKCTKAFPALLITGCATLIVTQALIHMCIVLGLLPVSGQPLPLISKGGTSILVMSAAFGMMLSVSKYAIQSSRRKADANTALKEAADDETDTAANPTAITNQGA